jgi:hypothetical protein
VVNVEDLFSLNHISGMENTGNSYNTTDMPSQAMGLDDDIASSANPLYDYIRFLGDLVSPAPTNRGIPLPASSHLANQGRKSTCNSALRKEWNQEEFKSLDSRILAIWAFWHSGELFQSDSLFDGFKFRSPLGVGIDQILPAGLDLSAWLVLYPRRVNPELTVHHLPFPEPDAASLTWKDYAEYGHIIASQDMRLGLAPVQCSEYVNISVRRLVAAILLGPDGSKYLRRCFNVILTNLSPILEDQVNRFDQLAKRFSIQLLASEEWIIPMYSHEEDRAAVLAMVCDREFRARGIHIRPAFKQAAAYLQERGNFSTERALVWAVRFILWFAPSPQSMSSLPRDLCTRALDGCRRVLQTVNSHPLQGLPVCQIGLSESSLSNLWQDTNFANLWADWICSDTLFFLHEQSTSSI